MIDLSNNMDSLRREYNTMSHKELESIYVNSSSNIFSVDTSFREQVGIDTQNKRFFSSTRLVTGYFPIDLIKGYHPSQKLFEAEEAVQL